MDTLDSASVDRILEGLSRRQLLLAGASGLFLVGCGGSHRGSGGSGGSGTEATTKVSVTVVLPSGLATTGLRFVTGRSEAALGKGRLSATVLAASPTLVSVVDTASSRVVMLGTIDPRESAHTLDATNVAATLIYLSLGSTQASVDERNALWTRVVGASATTGLATVVGARLNADPFALENGDAALVAALATAIDGLGSRSAKAAVRAKPRGASRANPSLPAPAVPAVEFQTELTDLFPNGNQILAGHLDGEKALPDYFTFLVNAPYETAAFVYYKSYTNGQAQSATLQSGPLAVSGNDVSLYSDNFPVALESADDSLDVLSVVSLSPRFDAPDGAPFADPIFASEVQAWRTTLASLRQRIVVGLASRLILEALGLGGLVPSREATTSVTASFLALGGGVASDLATASNGRNLDEAIDTILAYSTASDAQATAVVALLRPLAPDLLANVSPARLVQQSGSLRVARLAGAEGFAQRFGKIASALQATVALDDPLAASLSPTLHKVVLTLTPDSAIYSPGGANVKVALTSDPEDYLGFSSSYVAHYKLYGAGDATLDDGKGNVGREFDSSATSVTLATKSNATGLQTVGVELFRVTAAGRVSMVKTTTGVQPGTGGGQFTFPALQSTSPGGTLALAVIVHSLPSGVNPANVRYRWHLDDTAIGEFHDANGTGSAVDTTDSSIDFVASVDATIGNQRVVSVTVAAVDPKTGDFTNLAILSGTIGIRVGTGCELSIESPSFSLDALRNASPRHYLEGTQTQIGSDDQGLVLSGVYQPHGLTGSDYVYVTLRPGANVAQATTLSFDEGGNATASVLLGSATVGGLAYSFEATGSGQVGQVTRGSDGAVTYLEFAATLACENKILAMTFTAGIDAGI